MTHSRVKFTFLALLFITFVLTGTVTYGQEADFRNDPGISESQPAEWSPTKEGGMQNTDVMVSGGSNSSSRTRAASAEARKSESTQNKDAVTEKKSTRKEDGAKTAEKTSTDGSEDDSVMSFNFLYYLIHKFKFSEAIQ